MLYYFIVVCMAFCDRIMQPFKLITRRYALCLRMCVGERVGRLLGIRKEDQDLLWYEVMPRQLGHRFLKSLIVPRVYTPFTVAF